MKMTLGVKEVNYGSVTINVEKNATKDDIEEAAVEEIYDGMAYWKNTYETVTDVLDCEDSTVPCVSFDRFMEPAPKDTYKALFIKELENIHVNEWREAAIKMVDKVPDYFWEVPASSSGKYHPKCDLDEAGLVRHSIMVEKIALDLLLSEIFVPCTPELESAVRIAALFHDVIKQGDNTGHTVFEHPLLGAAFIRENLKDTVEPVYLNLICHAVERHMGKWTTSDYSDITLDKPESAFDKLIHTADLIASRKYIGGLTEWKI